MTTESVDELFIDVIGRLDESSIRVLRRRLDAETEQAGEEAGSNISEGMKGAMAALPAIAAATAVAVGAALAAGTVAIVNLAEESAGNVRNFQAQLGLTKEEAENLGDVAEEVFANTITGSLSDAGQAVKNVRQEFKDLSNEELARLTIDSTNIADAFEEDQAKVAQAIKVVMDTTGRSAKEATDFITAGFQRGLNKSEDFLDTLLEYGPQFEKAGISAEDLFSILESGAKAGALGTDKIADALKEFTLRANDGAKGTIEAYEQLGLSYDDLEDQIKSGALTQADLFKLVITRIQGIKNVADRTNITTALLGGAGEDLGEGINQLNFAKTKLEEIEGATEKLNVKYDSLGALFESVSRRLGRALLPIGEQILEIANGAMPVIKKAIEDITPTINAMAINFGDAIKLFARGETQASGVFIKIGSVAKSIFSSIEPVVKNAFNAIYPVIQELGPLVGSVFNLVSALWTNVLKPVVDALAPTWSIAITIIGGNLQGLLTLVTGIFNALSAVISGDSEKAGKIMEDTFQRVSKSVEDTFNRIANIVIAELNRLSTMARKFGQDLIAGFVAGIYAKINDARDVASNLAKIFLGQARKDFDTRSPSRVMETLGKFVGQGFVNGVASEDAKVKKSAQNLAKNFLDSLKNLSIERQVGRIDLSTYIKALEGAQSKLRAKLSTVKESSPAYTQWLGALSKVTKELDGLTGKSSDAAKEAKKLADQIKRNKDQIADIEANEKYVKGLRSATDEQLKNALAVAKNTGDLNKYNKIRSEQKRRIDAVRVAEEKGAKAAEDYAKAQERAFESAQRSIKQLDSFNLGGLDARLAAPDAITNTQETFDEMALRIARLRDELQKPGTFEAWKDGLKQMRLDGELTEQQLQTLLDQMEQIKNVNFTDGAVEARGGGIVDNGPLVQPDEEGPVKARGEIAKLKEELVSTARVSADYGEEWKKLMADLADTKAIDGMKERFAGVSDAQLEAAKSAAIARKDVLAYKLILEEEDKRAKEATESQDKLSKIKKEVAKAAIATKKPLSDQLERLKEIKEESPELAGQIEVVRRRILQLQRAAAKEDELKKMQENIKKASSELGDFGGKVNQVVGILSNFGGEVAGTAGIIGDYFTTNIKAAQQAMQGDYAGAILTSIEGIINIGDKIQALDPAFQQWKKNLNETGETIRKNMGPRVVNGVINPFFDSLERDLENRTELANANWMQRWWWNNFGNAPEVLDNESAKLLSEISAIFNKVATATTGAIQDELINAFNTGDWESAADEMSRKVQQSIAKIALDYIIQTSELAPKIAKFSEFFRKAIVGGLTEDEKKELNRLYDDIIEEQKRVAGRYRAIAEDLPGYERETQEKRYEEWKEWEEKREREEEKARKKRIEDQKKHIKEYPRYEDEEGKITGRQKTNKKVSEISGSITIDMTPIVQLQDVLVTLAPQIERGGTMIESGANRFAQAVEQFDRRVNWSKLNTVDS